MRKEILDYLKDNQDSYVSGEHISNALGVSRTAIWKNIKKLKEDGYDIDSVSNKGYKLVSGNPSLNIYELEDIIADVGFLDKAVHLKEVTSTNDYLKENYSFSREEVIVVADRQSKGRGRLGNEWTSDEGGIWMSLMLRPEIKPEDAPKITLAAAAAVCVSLRKLTSAEVTIKWPNDIILDGKKVCGILTEMGAELGIISYIVLGIGINVSQTYFQEDIRQKATSLKLSLGEEYSKVEIVLEFMKNFKAIYEKFISGDYHSIIDVNRKYSASIGKQVLIKNGDTLKEVYSKDINGDGELVVIDGDKEYTVNYGEVSIRGINGYI